MYQLPTAAAMMREAGIEEALRFTAAVSDGEQLVAVRWASDEKAPSLYYREEDGDLVVVSEPLDSDGVCWKPVPQGCALVARPGEAVTIRCMNEAMRQAA